MSAVGGGGLARRYRDLLETGGETPFGATDIKRNPRRSRQTAETRPRRGAQINSGGRVAMQGNRTSGRMTKSALVGTTAMMAGLRVRRHGRRRLCAGGAAGTVKEVVVTGSRITRRGLHVFQPDRDGHGAEVPEHLQRRHRDDAEQLPQFSPDQNMTRDGELGRCAAHRHPLGRHLHRQPQGPRRQPQPRARRRPAHAARQRQPRGRPERHPLGGDRQRRDLSPAAPRPCTAPTPWPAW